MPLNEPSYTETFAGLDLSLWGPSSHTLGHSWLNPGNVAVAEGVLRLLHPAGTKEGAEIHSTSKVGYGVYEAVMRTPALPGSISAFFLYEGGSRSDEIDIEILNDGSRTIMFTVWNAGRQVFHTAQQLPFDPAAIFNTYRIEYGRGFVRFLINGNEAVRWRSHRVPKSEMYLLANTWWPTWLSGAPTDVTRSLDIDEIRY